MKEDIIKSGKNNKSHLRGLDQFIKEEFEDKIKKMEIREIAKDSSIISILTEVMETRLTNIFTDNYWSNEQRPRTFKKPDYLKVDTSTDDDRGIILDDPKTLRAWNKILSEESK